jgi:hypothetical protein
MPDAMNHNRHAHMRVRRLFFLTASLGAVWQLWSLICSDKSNKTNSATKTKRKPALALALFLSSTPPQQVFLIPNQTDLTGVNRLRATTSKLVGVTPLEHCAPTTQIQLQIFNASIWILQSLDEQGNKKTVGGDEFYISYRDYGNPDWSGGGDATAVAIQTDLGDGRYLLDFVKPPMAMKYAISGSGKLIVHFQYTCGIGRMTDPEKDDWTYGGFLGLTTHTPLDVHVPAPAIRPFRMSTVNLSHYQAVLCFGDSIMNNYCGNFINGFLYRFPNVHCAGNAGGKLALATLDARNEKLQEWHGELLDKSNNSTSNTTVALLRGSAAWDLTEFTHGSVQGRTFDDHIQACRLLIEYVQKRYPKVAIFWKSPQAMHVHVLKESCFTNAPCRNRTKYTSSSNVYYLHLRQKALMDELGVPLIDLYEATYLSDSWMMDGDSRHYRKWLNKEMLSWSYPGFVIKR